MCEPINQDFTTGWGKCGLAWGRCNIFYKPNAPYCDLASEMCHNDVAMKTAQNDDSFDYDASNQCRRNYIIHMSELQVIKSEYIVKLNYI